MFWPRDFFFQSQTRVSSSMVRINCLVIFALLAVVLSVSSSQLIYRKYEKLNVKKNYVHVVEIYDTQQNPPDSSRNEKELNDFLGRDSFKQNKNRRRLNTTKPSITTQKAPTTSTPTQQSAWNNLITPRSTKPTIRPNPRENRNPDYSDLLLVEEENKPSSDLDNRHMFTINQKCEGNQRMDKFGKCKTLVSPRIPDYVE